MNVEFIAYLEAFRCSYLNSIWTISIYFATIVKDVDMRTRHFTLEKLSVS